ncbi:MAG: hypothetical protein JWN38_763 [Candidatus Saccharibacteria bacterium]|nr:hypothetical protein [Candidatus Saccharibacteria bacterium]
MSNKLLVAVSTGIIGQTRDYQLGLKISDGYYKSVFGSEGGQLPYKPNQPRAGSEVQPLITWLEEIPGISILVIEPHMVSVTIDFASNWSDVEPLIVQAITRYTGHETDDFIMVALPKLEDMLSDTDEVFDLSQLSSFRTLEDQIGLRDQLPSRETVVGQAVSPHEQPQRPLGGLLPPPPPDTPGLHLRQFANEPWHWSN